MMPISTGYEQVIGQRTDDMFCTTATSNGVITKSDKYGIEVTYDDGTVKSVPLGRRYGKSKGTTIPHDVITDLKEGDRVTPGKAIAWNTGFFDKSVLYPDQASFKMGMLVTTAFLDGPDTIEDSSAISEEVSNALSTSITYPRSVIVNFDQTILNAISENSHVEADSILCTIQDLASTNVGGYTDETIETLQMLADANPKAKHKGTVERIDVVYNGNIEDMDETLQVLATTSDRRLSRELAMSSNTKPMLNTGKNPTPGKTGDGYRIDGEPLAKNQLAVIFNITKDDDSTIGDKAVFGHQLKTVIGRVMKGINRTVSGIPLGALFGATSAENRIVESVKRISTGNTVLVLGTKHVVKMARNKV